MENKGKPHGPISAKMLALLKESFQREMEKRPPLDIYYTQSAKGLFQRGLLCTKEHKIGGKVFLKFHISEEGRNYLRDLTLQSNYKVSKSKKLKPENETVFLSR